MCVLGELWHEGEASAYYFRVNHIIDSMSMRASFRFTCCVVCGEGVFRVGRPGDMFATAQLGLSWMVSDTKMVCIALHRPAVLMHRVHYLLRFQVGTEVVVITSVVVRYR